MTEPQKLEELAQAALNEICKRYGPGFSNGVAAILLHEDLPESFGAECWAEWFFKPAEKAFTVAHSLGLIEPTKAGKWRLTPTGKAAALRARASEVRHG